jgi:hypothetical protein
MQKEITKRTVDLKKGDVVLLSDLVDIVDRVEDMGGVVVKVYVARRGIPLWWLAGKESEQRVLVNE